MNSERAFTYRFGFIFDIPIPIDFYSVLFYSRDLLKDEKNRSKRSLWKFHGLVHSPQIITYAIVIHTQKQFTILRMTQKINSSPHSL